MNFFTRCIFKRFGLIVILSILYSCNKFQRKYTAPDFTLNDVFGNSVNLFDILDKERPVLIINWALWCRMSIKELDALLEFADEMKSINIKILAIHQDSRQSAPEILHFAIDHNWIWNYCILLDTAKVFCNLYNIFMLPTTIAIDKNGEICFT
ncbi:MAG: peroxiredoxin family protein [bacterium]